MNDDDPDDLAEGSDPFAETGDDPFSAAPEPDRSPWVEMLRSTDPPITPSEVGRNLDVGEPWYNHFGAGFLKMSGSRGTEAWMHLLMGVALLFTQDLELGESENEGGGEPDRPQGSGASDGEVFEGPQ